MELNKIHNGDCLEVLKTFEDNSIDSCVTDPPYGLNFMNKHWDYDVPKVEVWKEVLRVLKPGGHLLCACGTRTQHRMAVNIEDAGFEIRDVITWHYGSGFPKSLNIGKAIDEMQGNERAVTGTTTSGKILRSNGNNERPYQEGKDRIETNITKGNSEYEGWGTALKPATEFWTLARKPLSDGGFDVAKTFSYLSEENDLKWRVKYAKPAKSKNHLEISSSIELPKMVEVSANCVRANETQQIGIEIERLLESMRINGETIMLSELKKTADYGTLQTEKEFQNQTETISENLDNPLLKPTVQDVNAAENLKTDFLPLTTSKAGEESIERKLKGQTLTDFSKKKATPKINTGYSAGTVTGLSVCMEVALTLKVNFDGKEYFFDKLTDGSFVWPDNLTPYIKPKPLNVAGNVLKYGTGGINIDGSRIEWDDKGLEGDTNRRKTPRTDITGAQFHASTGGDNAGKYIGDLSSPSGRFPANVIFDEFTGKILDEQTGILTSGTGAIRKNAEGLFGLGGDGGINTEYGDTGGASRFFYCPKADDFERNKGLKGFDEKLQANANFRPNHLEKALEGDSGKPHGRYSPRANNHPTVKPIDLMRYLVKLITPKKGICLDPYCGSGTTLIGCKMELINYIGIEREEDYCKIAEARVAAWNPDKYLPQTLF